VKRIVCNTANHFKKFFITSAMEESSAHPPEAATLKPTSASAKTDRTNQHIYNSYYGQNNATTNPQMHDSQYDGQYVDQIEEHRELQYQQQIQHEIRALNLETDRMRSSNFGGRAFPTMVVSLAHKLLPTVVQRLTHQDVLRNGYVDTTNDEFEGLCAPLGNSESAAPEAAAAAAAVYANLKTTGIEDERTSEQNIIRQERRVSDLEMGDSSEYLPESAALLINALNNSVKKEKRRGSNGSFTNLPSLLDEVLKDDTDADGTTFDNFEKEAEALLQSIQSEDTKPTAAAAAASPSSNTDDALPSFDDDDSICGDMVRLSQSIAFLQQDLENVDVSHFDQLYGDGMDALDGEGSAWSRMKLWFSRGMIMEQKLLNTMNGMDGGNHEDNTSTTSRYSDNPVLIWSLAIMWAFILLIMGHHKIAEWVEGEDPGRLADVIEWMFS
jgi:hypothetical protein